MAKEQFETRYHGQLEDGRAWIDITAADNDADVIAHVFISPDGSFDIEQNPVWRETVDEQMEARISRWFAETHSGIKALV